MDRGAGRAPDLIPPDLVTARGDYRRLAVAPTRSRAPIRHLGRARIPSARSDPPGSVDDRDAGASPIRAASGYGTQAAVRAFNGLPDDLDAPAIADQSVPRSAADPRSERRSDDGQTILAPWRRSTASPRPAPLVGMAGFEPAASCSQISSIWTLDVAPCRSISGSPEAMHAARGLTWLGACAR